MSQTENAGTSSSKAKRPYRKGNPLSLAERQQAYNERKRNTHALVSATVRKDLKEKLLRICEEKGMTQRELIEELLEQL
ncbi:replication regulatory protein RepA [Serratia bockelmannii]|uniref:replication regulatory protein RepA n=1 Tax=Serratia TaxID=613 RepID=UPI00217A4CA5|nr:replication regulatory protein RepA [Serratia ficaria]CAI1224383.1 replication protein [Serratia ficaria]CAI1241395.1 replication protein [Serratia ficaria]CAI2032049.1 replication protein [Serratia ficaria]CAI2533945.1 replication protein [Serratia ficaria]CAI2537327.1 replication protein [Serratia ficaria]